MIHMTSRKAVPADTVLRWQIIDGIVMVNEETSSHLMRQT